MKESTEDLAAEAVASPGSVAAERSGPRLDPLDFEAFSGDALGRLLIGQLQISPFWMFLGVLGVVCVLGATGALIYALAIPSTSPGEAFSSLGWASIPYVLLVVPLTFGFYIWVTRESGRLFAGLFREGVFEADEVRFRSGVVGASGFVRTLHSSSGWAVASAAITVAVVVMWTVGGAFFADAWDEARILMIIGLPVAAVGVYMVCMIAAREFCTVIGLWQMFRNYRLKLRPFHPDRAGGLAKLSRFAVACGYFLATAGFGLSLLSINSFAYGHFESDYMLHVALGIYSILAPLTFFGMLGSAHGAMAEAKARWLTWISDRFDRDYTAVIGALDEDRDVFAGQVEKVSHLHSLYRLTEAFPVWPFDARSIGRFAGIMIAPLVTVAASAVVSVLLRV